MKKTLQLIIARGAALAFLCLLLAACASLASRDGAPALAGVSFHLLAQPEQQGALPSVDMDGKHLRVAPRVWIGGSSVVSVRKVIQQGNYKPAIILQLDAAGARRLAQLTGRNLGKQLAILAPNGQAVFVGEIQGAIDNGQMMFSGMSLARQQQIYQLLTGKVAP